LIKISKTSYKRKKNPQGVAVVTIAVVVVVVVVVDGGCRGGSG
jgi:hypothetical protein